MRALGISLIVAGLAVVCGALILWPRASRTDEEEKTESRKEEKRETGEMADLLRPLKHFVATLLEQRWRYTTSGEEAPGVPAANVRALLAGWRQRL